LDELLHELLIGWCEANSLFKMISELKTPRLLFYRFIRPTIQRNTFAHLSESDYVSMTHALLMLF